LIDTCSYCGKSKSEVAKLAVNGPGTAAFCNECAKLVLDAVEDEKE
jgi:ATP-dependent protease Clp ATPase subunit